MARHETFTAETQQPLGLDDLLELLNADPGLGSRERHQAIACYLSGADGWREAVKQLGGAFAEDMKVKGT